MSPRIGRKALFFRMLFLSTIDPLMLNLVQLVVVNNGHVRSASKSCLRNSLFLRLWSHRIFLTGKFDKTTKDVRTILLTNQLALEVEHDGIAPQLFNTRWYKVTFWSLLKRSLYLSKRSLNHPKKGHNQLPGSNNRQHYTPNNYITSWTPRWRFGRWISFSVGWCSSSMLIFRGVSLPIADTT